MRILELDVNRKIDAGAYRHPVSEMTLLLVAAFIKDNASLCQALLDRDADPAAVDIAGENAVFLAASRGHTAGVLPVLFSSTTLGGDGAATAIWKRLNKFGNNVVHAAALAGERGSIMFMQQRVFDDDDEEMWKSNENSCYFDRSCERCIQRIRFR